MSEELVKRLRRGVNKPAEAKRRPSPRELEAADRIEELEARYHREQDRIERLIEENERLRGALRDIARLRTDLSGDFSLGSKQSDIARKALEEV
jgi:MoxR-like ATPase